MAHIVINEAFLQQLERLEMLIKNNYAGVFGGSHKSKTFGSSCEFADFRDYMPGDDITKIDWNAYARFDKLYQKLYYDERQMHTRIYIDASRSMEYGDGKKSELALRLAAALAYLSVSAMDKVSIFAVRDGILTDVAVGMFGKESYLSCIGALNSVEFDGDSRISDAIFPTNVGKGDGMSIIISDFLTENNFEDAVTLLADKKRDVVCLQILAREELNPQIRGKMHLFDSENAARTYKKNIDREIIGAYKKALQYTIDRIRNHCAARDAEYLLIPADTSVEDVIFAKMIDMGVFK